MPSARPPRPLSFFLSQGSWEEFEEQRKLNAASKWVLQSGVGVILLVFTIRWLIGRARFNVSSNSRLPSSTSSADLHQPPAPTRRPPSLNNKLRHLVARRATLGQWDLRTNWGMMSLWLVWFTYNAYMTFVRPPLPSSPCLTDVDKFPLLPRRSTPTPSSERVSPTCPLPSGGTRRIGQFSPLFFHSRASAND